MQILKGIQLIDKELTAKEKEALWIENELDIMEGIESDIIFIY